MDEPILFLHGYGANGQAFDAWRAAFVEMGFARHHVVAYEIHSNEVDLSDLAEAVERVIRHEPALEKAKTIHCVAHSTGMLVLQVWIRQHPRRLGQLGWVIGFSPASTGSPLAHKGRGMLAALVNGRVDTPSDRFEGGDRILAALELGSPDTWELTAKGPYVPTQRLIVFSGLRAYDFPRNLLHEPGSDGVVRFAGTHPAVARIEADLTRSAPIPRVRSIAHEHTTWPTVPLPEAHHGSILADPPKQAVRIIRAALTGAPSSYLLRRIERVRHQAVQRFQRQGRSDPRWTQFVVRLENERGEAVEDYYLEVLIGNGEGNRPKWTSLFHAYPQVDLRVHVNRTDASSRTFHLDLASAPIHAYRVALRIAARSNSRFVGYRGFQEELELDDPQSERMQDVWTAMVDLTPALASVPAGQVRPFADGTSTYIRIRIDREPLPFMGTSRLAALVQPDA